MPNGLFDQLTTEEGRERYRQQYGDDNLQAALQHMQNKLDDAAEAAGVATGAGAPTEGDTEAPGVLQPIPADLRKPQSEHDRQSKADFYEAARTADVDPNEAWDALPRS